MNRILCSTGAVTGVANGNDFRMPARLDGEIPCDGWEPENEGLFPHIAHLGGGMA